MLRLYRRSAHLSSINIKSCIWSTFRAYSDAATTESSPLLAKLRTDLKTAMRAKDKGRLNVLKSVLADVTNASKTQSPITTDVQLSALLRKRSAASKEAIVEYKAAGRDDLVAKEEEETAVLDEYAGSVKMMSVDDIRQTVRTFIQKEGPNAKLGPVMKTILSPGGVLFGRNVDKSVLPGIVKEQLEAK